MGIYGHKFDSLIESRNNEVIIEEVILQEGLIRDLIKGIKNKRKNNKEKYKLGNKPKILKGKVEVEFKEVKSKGELDSLYKSEALVFEGLNITKENADMFVDNLDKMYGVSEKKLTVYAFDGKLMNSIYDLHDDNKYPNDLHFIGLPLNAFMHKVNGAPVYSYLKARGFRFFNDIVDNNEYREYINGYHEKSDQIKWLINAMGDKK